MNITILYYFLNDKTHTTPIFKFAVYYTNLKNILSNNTTNNA